MSEMINIHNRELLDGIILFEQKINNKLNGMNIDHWELYWNRQSSSYVVVLQTTLKDKKPRSINIEPELLQDFPNLDEDSQSHFINDVLSQITAV